MKLQAWAGLSAAAIGFAKEPTDRKASQALSDAAKKWAAAAGGPATPEQRVAQTAQRLGVVLVPFDRSKGEPLSSCEVKDLEWLLSAVNRSVDDPEKERFRGKNVELRDAIEAELESRR